MLTKHRVFLIHQFNAAHITDSPSSLELDGPDGPIN